MVACTLIVVGDDVGGDGLDGVESVADGVTDGVTGGGVDPAGDGAGANAVGASEVATAAFGPFAGVGARAVVLGSTRTKLVWVALNVASGWLFAPSLTRPPSRTTMPANTPRATATASAVSATSERRATRSPLVTDRLRCVPRQ